MDWASQQHTFATLGSSKIMEHIEFLALQELEEAKSSAHSEQVKLIWPWEWYTDF